MKDMTVGSPTGHIIAFAIPMLIGNVFQQLYSVIDSIIVGRVLGKEALAAVGNSFPIFFILIAFLMGIGMGSTVLIAQNVGAKNYEMVKKTINTSYVLLFIVTILFTFLGIFTVDFVLKAMQTPKEVFQMSKTFLTITYIGFFAMCGYNFLSAILRGLGDSKTPLYFLIISTILNIVLEILFVYNLRLGIAGAAFATVIAQAISFVLSAVYLNIKHPIIDFKFKDMKLDFEIAKKIIGIGLPSGLQQIIVAFGMMFLQSLINGFGTNAMAAYNAASRIDSFTMMPLMTFGLSITTFVGQNIGAGKVERVKKGFNATLIISLIFSFVTVLMLVIFSKQLISLFIKNAETEVINIGVSYIYRVSSFMFLGAVLFVTSGALRGAGDVLIPTFTTITSLILIRIPLAYIIANKTHDITKIWWSYPIGWFFGSVLCLIYYFKGTWKEKVLKT